MFESDRLIYRKLEYSDFSLFYELYSDSKVMAYAYMDKLETKEEADQVFDDIMTRQNHQEKGVQYVAVIKSSGIAIGLVDYDVIIKHEEGGMNELGYFIKPDYWGQGFGTEMGRSLIDYLFSNTNIHRMMARCNANNKASENIMIKLGMKWEGSIRRVRYKNNRWEDENIYGILREEWEASH